jgi:hypothetical protein
MVTNFKPNAPDLTFMKGEEVELSNFGVKVKNGAAKLAGNNIYKATSGDNYAIHLYFAQADLAVNPTAKKSPPFAATLNTGDLSVALKAAFSTMEQKLKSMITLPEEECSAYMWLCACVREGRGAKYKDSNPDNNCECKDVSSQVQCGKNFHLLYAFVSRSRGPPCASSTYARSGPRMIPMEFDTFLYKDPAHAHPYHVGPRWNIWPLHTTRAEK